jgi:hypothetical protein
MRTTISIEDSLLKKAKAASINRNCSLGEVIEDALRIELNDHPKSNPQVPLKPLKTFRGSGVQPGVDLSASSSLLEVMEGR